MNAFDAGIDALVAGDLKAAEQHLKRAWQSGERVADAQYFLGIAAIRAQRFDVADTLLAQGLHGGLSETAAHVNLGRVYRSLDPESARAMELHLRHNRLVPRASIGQLAGDADIRNVEPWYFSRRSTALFPRDVAVFADPAKVIRDEILPGHVPPGPILDGTARILTLGSCFAAELRGYLARLGLRSDWLFVPSGLNNTFALRNFVDWALTGDHASDAYWYDEHEAGGALQWQPPGDHAEYRRIFQDIDALVLTVGLAEVWYDTQSGGVFWRGVPKSIYDPDRHVCRVSSVEENRANLAAIVTGLRKLRPELPIVVTLSPVPLKATFQARSCFTADCVSKSILRVAIDEVLRMGVPHLYYWPSFEIVRWLGGHLDQSMFGDDGNPRHVNRDAVALILDAFVEAFFTADAFPHEP